MSRRIEDIELLRAVGILYVLSEHAFGNLIFWPSPGIEHLYSYVRGASGVDLFFAISGFVIARDLLPRLLDSPSIGAFTYTTLAFWVRRIWRIFPSAWLWLAIILLATVFFNHSGAFGLLRPALNGTIAAVLQIANIGFVLCFGQPEHACGANFYYWSLSLEEQFYMLLPLTALLFRKWLPLVLAVLAVYLITYPDRSMLGTMIRGDALLLGVLIAYWSRKSSYRLVEPRFLARSLVARFIVTVGLFVALAAAATFFPGKLAPFRLGIIAVIAALLVFVASYDRNYLLVPHPLRQAMLWLGARSCTIYLIHIPAFFATREIWYRITPSGTKFDASYTFPFILTAATIILVCSEINFRLVEAPFRRKGAEISKRLLQRHQIPPRQVAET